MNLHQSKFNDYLKEFFIKHPKLGLYYEICEGGKKLRPSIILEIASYLKNDWENGIYRKKILDYAVMVELIHSTSLIIDDLPSMDNDKFRRGKLSFHAKHGQHKSYLMVYNLLMAIKKLIIGLCKDDPFERAYLELEEFVNLEISNLIGGQKKDLNPKWKLLGGSRSLKIAEEKTASLFKLSFLGPYFILKPSLFFLNHSQLEKLLYQIGNHFGLAFQLSDDHLDIGTDQKWNNYGLETSPEELKEKFQEYVQKLEDGLLSLGYNQDFLFDLISLMRNRFD